MATTAGLSPARTEFGGAPADASEMQLFTLTIKNMLDDIGTGPMFDAQFAQWRGWAGPLIARDADFHEILQRAGAREAFARSEALAIAVQVWRRQYTGLCAEARWAKLAAMRYVEEFFAARDQVDHESAGTAAARRGTAC